MFICNSPSSPEGAQRIPLGGNRNPGFRPLAFIRARFDNGPAMMAHLINGKGREIAFGAIIEILMFRDQGLKLAGPLPPEVQHWTAYVAAPMVAAPNAAGAQSFLQYLATAPAKALFAAHGIE